VNGTAITQSFSSDSNRENKTKDLMKNNFSSDNKFSQHKSQLRKEEKRDEVHWEMRKIWKEK